MFISLLSNSSVLELPTQKINKNLEQNCLCLYILHVCMYVHVQVSCVYVCMYVCIMCTVCVCTVCLCTVCNVCMYLCMYRCVCMYVCMCVYVCMYVRMYVRTYVGTYMSRKYDSEKLDYVPLR